MCLTLEGKSNPFPAGLSLPLGSLRKHSPGVLYILASSRWNFDELRGSLFATFPCFDTSSWTPELTDHTLETPYQNNSIVALAALSRNGGIHLAISLFHPVADQVLTSGALSSSVFPVSTFVFSSH